jgi:hypothetical protein
MPLPHERTARQRANPPPKKMILLSMILSNLCAPTCQNRYILPVDAISAVSNDPLYPKFRKNLKKIAPIWQFCDQMSCKLFIINIRIFSLTFVVPKNIKILLTPCFFFVICCAHVF